MNILNHWLIEKFRQYDDRTAIISGSKEICYREFLENINRWKILLDKECIKQGDCVSVIGPFNEAIAALTIALINQRCIIVPIASSSCVKQYITVANVDFTFYFDGSEKWRIKKRLSFQTHPLIRKLVLNRKAGLVLFSSGTTGEPKASLLDFDKLLDKFRDGSRGMRTLVFLLLDHIGGINTLFAVLTQGGTLVIPTARDPNSICKLVEKYKIELLPTTPTFLRMLLISESLKRYDLSSLIMITYGTEPMSESTLNAITKEMRWVQFKQTYGLTELGIMSTRSENSSSTKMKIGGKGFEYKVVDGVLWIKSQSSMLGYLNHKNPFYDGWFNTGDIVEIDGEYLNILGRKSELINVGGEKVHPVEIENLLQECGNIYEATVYGKSNPITGQIVAANISLVQEEPEKEVVRRIHRKCSKILESYKVPRYIKIVSTPHHGERFKKRRKV